jgi:hypothetical protein
LLTFLLDEHISLKVADQIAARRPDIIVNPLAALDGGRLLGEPDGVILAEARQRGLTFVTYDKQTVAPLLRDLADHGVSHAGVLFHDRNTTPQRSVGAIVRRIERAFDTYKDLDWTDCVMFLTQ